MFADGSVSATLVSQADDLDPNLYPDDLMSLDLAPGERRHPSPLDVQIIDAVRSTTQSEISSGIIPKGGTNTTGTTRGAALLPTSQPGRGRDGSDADGIVNGNFAITDPTNLQFGWSERGSVSVASNQGVLSENPNVFSELAQTFAVPADASALRFTVDGQFSPNGIGPPDAFEAALLDANTGLSAVAASCGPVRHRRVLQSADLGPDLFQPPETRSFGVVLLRRHGPPPAIR